MLERKHSVKQHIILNKMLFTTTYCVIQHIWFVLHTGSTTEICVSTTYVCYSILYHICILQTLKNANMIFRLYVNQSPTIKHAIRSILSGPVCRTFQVVISSRYFYCTASTANFESDNVFYELCFHVFQGCRSCAILRGTETSGDLYVCMCVRVCTE